MASLNSIALESIMEKRMACWYATTASTMLLVYDWFATFDEEVELVWNSPWSPPKVIFLMNRYLGLCFSLLYTILLHNPNQTVQSCKVAFDFQVWSVWLGIVVIELLLMIWVHAVCQLNRRLLLPLTGMFVFLATSSAIILGIRLPREHVEVAVPACVLLVSQNETDILNAFTRASSPRDPSTLLVSLIPSVIFELFLLALLAYRAIVYFGVSTPGKAPNSDIAYVLIRDSITYFIIIFVAYFVNAMIWTFASSQLFQVGVGFGITLPCLLGSRLLLNLRDVYRRQAPPTASLFIQTERWDHLFTFT